MDHKDVKSKLIEHMMTLDLNRMTLADLQQYANITKTISEIDKPGYEQILASIASNNLCACSKAEEKKECENNG